MAAVDSGIPIGTAPDIQHEDEYEDNDQEEYHETDAAHGPVKRKGKFKRALAAIGITGHSHKHDSHKHDVVTKHDVLEVTVPPTPALPAHLPSTHSTIATPAAPYGDATAYEKPLTYEQPASYVQAEPIFEPQAASYDQTYDQIEPVHRQEAFNETDSASVLNNSHPAPTSNQTNTYYQQSATLKQPAAYDQAAAAFGHPASFEPSYASTHLSASYPQEATIDKTGDALVGVSFPGGKDHIANKPVVEGIRDETVVLHPVSDIHPPLDRGSIAREVFTANAPTTSSDTNAAAFDTSTAAFNTNTAAFDTNTAAFDTHTSALGTTAASFRPTTAAAYDTTTAAPHKSAIASAIDHAKLGAHVIQDKVQHAVQDAKLGAYAVQEKVQLTAQGVKQQVQTARAAPGKAIAYTNEAAQAARQDGHTFAQEEMAVAAGQAGVTPADASELASKGMKHAAELASTAAAGTAVLGGITAEAATSVAAGHAQPVQGARAVLSKAAELGTKAIGLVTIKAMDGVAAVAEKIPEKQLGAAVTKASAVGRHFLDLIPSEVAGKSAAAGADAASNVADTLPNGSLKAKVATKATDTAASVTDHAPKKPLGKVATKAGKVGAYLVSKLPAKAAGKPVEKGIDKLDDVMDMASPQVMGEAVLETIGGTAAAVGDYVKPLIKPYGAPVARVAVNWQHRLAALYDVNDPSHAARAAGLSHTSVQHFFQPAVRTLQRALNAVAAKSRHPQGRPNLLHRLLSILLLLVQVVLMLPLLALIGVSTGADLIAWQGARAMEKVQRVRAPAPATGYTAKGSGYTATGYAGPAQPLHVHRD